MSWKHVLTARAQSRNRVPNLAKLYRFDNCFVSTIKAGQCLGEIVTGIQYQKSHQKDHISVRAVLCVEFLGMPLESIGFYTLSDARAAQAGPNSPLWRCELILTSRCNFSCPYCRHVGGEDLPYEKAETIIDLWADHGLKNIRFSGGEPTLYKRLAGLVCQAKSRSVERIAVSTNGSAPIEQYLNLLACGVNDFSISLDACCAEDFKQMAGGVKASWDDLTRNIRVLSELTYVTVGIVLTPKNAAQINSTIQCAHDLGVADIRVIPAAQEDIPLGLNMSPDAFNAHPILRYRLNNALNQIPVRGLRPTDSNRCGLVMDDMAVMGDKHYPCIIYMREGGDPIGIIGPSVRQDRMHWTTKHNTHNDPICSRNCLDVCVAYNNQIAGRIER